LHGGWLDTGDLGFLTRTASFTSSAGKRACSSAATGKFSPEGIEEALTSGSPFIDQIMLYNSQSPYTVALIVPNMAALRGWAKQQGLSADKPQTQLKVLGLLKEQVDAYRDGGSQEGLFPSKWLPAAFGVLEEGFSEENQLLNATLKMVRSRSLTLPRDDRLLVTKDGRRSTTRRIVMR
jgi:long-chain acyl-CoA synthetase